MSFERRAASGTSLNLISARRAAQMYPVRPLLESICDRFRAGASYGTLHYGLILNAAAAAAVYAETGLECSLLAAACYVSQPQAAELRKLGEDLDTLPRDADVPRAWLDRVPIPLPRFVRGTGTLTLAENLFKFKASRSQEGVAGFSALTLDIDVYTVLSEVEQRPEHDIFGLRYVAAAAWHNRDSDDQILRCELFKTETIHRDAPLQRGLARYSTAHPLSGTRLYEVRHRRRKLVLAPELKHLEQVIKAAPHGWETDEDVLNAVAEYLLELLQEAGLSPSCCTLSGRGIHLRWRLAEWVPCAAAERVLAAQLALHALLKPAGSDPSCATDSSRLYRVPGLHSERVGRRVERYRYQACGHRYSHLLSGPRTLDGWTDQLFEHDRHVLRRRSTSTPSSPEQAPRPTSEDMRRARRRNLVAAGERRVKALFDLAVMRGGIHRGERHRFLWCAASLIRSHVPTQHRDAQFERFLGMMQPCLPSREVNRIRGALETAAGRRQWHLTNGYICDVLDIDGEELEALPALAPVEPPTGAWKRTAKRAFLVALLESGTPTHLIANLLGYQLESLYVMTSRVYASGALRRGQVLRARLRWSREHTGRRLDGIRRRRLMETVLPRVSTAIPLGEWLRAHFDVPGGAALQPGAPPLLALIERARVELIRLVQDTTTEGTRNDAVA